LQKLLHPLLSLLMIHPGCTSKVNRVNWPL
jgi:hypothetical protein